MNRSMGFLYRTVMATVYVIKLISFVCLWHGGALTAERLSLWSLYVCVCVSSLIYNVES